MSRLLKHFSRESIGDISLSEIELKEAQNDTSLPADMVTELDIPAEEIASGFTEIEVAQADQESLATTSELAEATLADDGPGLDPTAAELISKEINIAAERYGLTRAKSFGKESFKAAATRRSITRDLARESEEASKGIGTRIKEGLKRLYEMLVKFVQDLLDKTSRNLKRAKATKAKLAGSNFKEPAVASKVKLSVLEDKDGKIDVENFKVIKNRILNIFHRIITLKEGDFSIDIGVINGTQWKANCVDGVYDIESTVYEKEGFFKTVNKDEASKLISVVIDLFEELKRDKFEFSDLLNDVKTVINDLEKAGNDSRLQSFQVAATLFTKVLSSYAKAATSIIDLVEQSMVGKATPESN